MFMIGDRLDIVLIIVLMVQLGMGHPRRRILLLVSAHYGEVIVVKVAVMVRIGGIGDNRLCFDIVRLLVHLGLRLIMRNVVSIVFVNFLHYGLLMIDRDSVGILIALIDNRFFVMNNRHLVMNNRNIVMNNWHMIIMVNSMVNDDRLLVVGNCMTIDFLHRLLMRLNNFMVSSRVKNIV